MAEQFIDGNKLLDFLQSFGDDAEVRFHWTQGILTIRLTVASPVSGELVCNQQALGIPQIRQCRIDAVSEQLDFVGRSVAEVLADTPAGSARGWYECPTGTIHLWAAGMYPLCGYMVNPVRRVLSNSGGRLCLRCDGINRANNQREVDYAARNRKAVVATD